MSQTDEVKPQFPRAESRMKAFLRLHGANPTDLRDRVTSRWSAMYTVSGIATGFTYVVIAAEKDLGNVLVNDIFGILVTSAFIFTLFGALLSQFWVGVIDVLGPNGTKVILGKFDYLVRAPLRLAMLGMLLFTLSVLPLIYAHFTAGVFYFACTLWFIVIAAAIIIYFWIESELSELLDKTEDELEQEYEHQHAGDEYQKLN